MQIALLASRYITSLHLRMTKDYTAFQFWVTLLILLKICRTNGLKNTL